MRRKIIIFGTGENGEKTFRRLGGEDTLVAFADDNVENIGKSCCGKTVISPHEISRHGFDIIRIATFQWWDSYRQLTDFGIESLKMEIIHFDKELRLPLKLFLIIALMLIAMFLYIRPFGSSF